MVTNYNPDVLSCLSNLSNDEVFTPPDLANRMLDLLPPELWRNKHARFLDPFCKSGVFLREIAKRLITGLEDEIPDRQERINHIYRNQLFGIAITQLTSLLSRRSVYCSKTANGQYSVVEGFDDEQGNILFDRIEHTWVEGRCSFCGASEEVYSRGEELETHAYQFIHTDNPEEFFNMKFDVIIGNPPYQLSDGGFGRSAKPVYHRFVHQAKLLSPRFLTMVIPARWFAGGKGLDEFRSEMLNDKRIRKLVDFENSADVFPGVDIAGGICYFLWDRDSIGDCEVTTNRSEEIYVSTRKLNEFEIFIRDSRALSILEKVKTNSDVKQKNLSQRISPRKPFGLPTNYPPKNSGTPCWFIQRIGLKYANSLDIIDEKKHLNKWKLLIPATPIAGQTDFSKPVKFYYDGNIRIAKPGECCTESWLVACAMDSLEEVLSFKSYLFTKIVRFLLLQTVISQHVNRQNFFLIPDLEEYKNEFSDELLINLWKIDSAEWDYIDQRIS